MRLLLLLPTFLSCFFFNAQEIQHQSLLLDESLTKNANAVVRLDETDIVLLSEKKMSVSKRRIITVLKKAGKSAINPYVFYDPVTKISDIQMRVYNANGEEIKKVKKKDLKDVSAVDGGTLYSDSRVKYFQYTPTTYPYTVDFSYSYETSNTAFLPKWSPVDEYMVSTEKSSFKLSFPPGIKVRKREKNFEGYPIKKSSTEGAIQYQIANIPAAKWEMLSPPFYTIEPRLLVSLSDFYLEGVSGKGHDWESMGQWQYNSLLSNRDILPKSTINIVSSMLKDVDDPLEKTKKIYQYVQDNTRYISVQLGIGGWMPIEATEVDKVKYGDCKGLTNYTKALLKSQGIESYYSVVWAGDSKRNIENDFASMEGNHVILNVPIEDKDIWLECTSQTIPFGFLSSFTDDRDVLVVTPEGGIVKHTDAYLNEDNLKVTKAVFQITNEGGLKGKVDINSHGVQYNKHANIDDLSEKKKDEYYKEYWDNINGLEINSIALENVKDNVQFIEHVEVQARDYAKKIGEELLFKPNPFDASDFVPNRYRNRKLPFEIARGYLNQDKFTITLPSSYKVKSLPKPIKIDSKYGVYEINIERESENQLMYTRKLLVYKGKYPKEEYSEYRNFRRSVVKGDNQKLILKK